MDRGFSEQAIVIVKWEADEVLVTGLRITLPISDKEVGGKGRAMEVYTRQYETPVSGDQPCNQESMDINNVEIEESSVRRSKTRHSNTQVTYS
jgi:hypothetical protein